MEIGNVFLVLGIASAVPGIYCLIKILTYLSARGERVNFFLLRLKWFHYMERYKQLTTEENGKVGPFLRGYFIAMLIALVLTTGGALLLR
jgi:hypothetical protein